MGDAACKLTYRVHLLSLTELLFTAAKGLSRRVAFRHISHGCENGVPAFQLEMAGRDLHEDLRAVLGVVPSGGHPGLPMARRGSGFVRFQRDVGVLHGVPLGA